MLVAILRERNALHQFHHEKWPAIFGRAGIENLGDVRVVHQGQSLPLGLKPGEDRSRVHADLDQLERDPPFDRLQLFGEIDGAHAPFADLFAELVPARDHAADLLGH